MHDQKFFGLKSACSSGFEVHFSKNSNLRETLELRVLEKFDSPENIYDMTCKKYLNYKGNDNSFRT